MILPFRFRPWAGALCERVTRREVDDGSPGMGKHCRFAESPSFVPCRCYFAKKKLVWEVLEQGLKSKIEVQWGDIRRIKADCSETEPGVLEIEISKAPMFFHELNPQPRKHTIWSSASDFTGGQATIARWAPYCLGQIMLLSEVACPCQSSCPPLLRSTMEYLSVLHLCESALEA